MKDRLFPGSLVIKSGNVYMVVAVCPGSGLSGASAWRVLLLGSVLHDVLIHEATENVTWVSVKV